MLTLMMNPMAPSEIIDKMYNNDPFSQWLGIERVDEGPGFCVLRLKVREEMLNGFSIAHGGITYSLADSALAFASNAHGRKCVSVETNISHVQPVMEGDVLTTHVKEVSLSGRIGIYHVTVRNQHDVDVAIFKGSVYRRSEEW
jgi:acyl-CoA thioesterase